MLALSNKETNGPACDPNLYCLDQNVGDSHAKNFENPHPRSAPLAPTTNISHIN